MNHVVNIILFISSKKPQFVAQPGALTPRLTVVLTKRAVLQFSSTEKLIILYSLDMNYPQYGTVTERIRLHDFAQNRP